MSTTEQTTVNAKTSDVSPFGDTQKQIHEQPEKYKVEKNVDLNIYRQEVVNATLYKLTGNFFIKQQYVENTAKISFSPKNGMLSEIQWVEENFENELIDQQIRFDTEKKFGEIRDIIVKKAFSPIK